jgi:uncharacterized membrane protein
MLRLWNSTTKSAKARIALTLLAVLGTAAGFAFAAAGSGDFSVSAAPSTRTVLAGQSTSYAVSIARQGGFSSAVDMSVAGLPGGATAAWSPDKKIPGNGSSATLAIATKADTKPGTYPLTIKGDGGGLSRTTSVTLVVQGPDFTVAATPSSRTVIHGDATSYSVDLTRLFGFSDPIQMQVSGLPGGVDATWSPDKKITGSPATLTVLTKKNTKPGTYTLTIKGDGGGLSHTATVTLIVKPDFALTATPDTQTIPAGQSTTYLVDLGRDPGFDDKIDMQVQGLPGGASASWSPSQHALGSQVTLTIDTKDKTKLGTYTLTIKGDSSGIQRTTTATLIIAQAAPPFVISGDVTEPLKLDVWVPIDVFIGNPNGTTMKLTSLTVSVDDVTTNASCGGLANYEVTQFSGIYPVLVPNGGASLSTLGILSSEWPKVRIKNRPVNQDACKGAGITLHYAGTSTP